jgi:hypothetical protein
MWLRRDNLSPKVKEPTRVSYDFFCVVVKPGKVSVPAKTREGSFLSNEKFV